MDIATDDAILDTQWSEWTEGFLNAHLLIFFKIKNGVKVLVLGALSFSRRHCANIY
jgi:hypothetical protein